MSCVPGKPKLQSNIYTFEQSHVVILAELSILFGRFREMLVEPFGTSLIGTRMSSTSVPRGFIFPLG
jgi:hypothetical protein